MNDSSGALQRLGEALSSGDRDAVMTCFVADATLDLISGEERILLTSTGIRDAVDTLLAGFDHIKLTPISRQLSTSRVVQESVLSGDHTGTFCGAEPTSGRVRVNVKLSATAATDSNVQSLSVEADTRALFAQIAGTDDVVGVTGGLIAAARERHDGAMSAWSTPTDHPRHLPLTRAPHRGSHGRIAVRPPSWLPQRCSWWRSWYRTPHPRAPPWTRAPTSPPGHRLPPVPPPHPVSRHPRRIQELPSRFLSSPSLRPRPCLMSSPDGRSCSIPTSCSVSTPQP